MITVLLFQLVLGDNAMPCIVAALLLAEVVVTLTPEEL